MVLQLTEFFLSSAFCVFILYCFIFSLSNNYFLWIESGPCLTQERPWVVEVVLARIPLRYILHIQSVSSLDGRLRNPATWQRGSVVFASRRHRLAIWGQFIPVPMTNFNFSNARSYFLSSSV